MEREAYAAHITSSEPELLYQLRRETHQKFLYPRMLSGPYQGRLLTLITQMYRPQHVLEVGTYTGYACICFGQGLPPNGRITTLELDPERGWLIRKYLEKAGLSDKVDLRFGRALELLPYLPGPFDLIFLDADKANYPTYFDVLLPKMPVGGIMLADNVLWDGKVIDPMIRDKETIGIRTFNEKVKVDPRVSQVLLPLRDGLMVIRKESEG